MKKLKQQLEKRIPSIEAAYEETGLPRVDFSVYPEHLRINRQANYEVVVLVEAARKIERENGSGEIDWSNWSQRKWIPWFRMSPSSFAFDGSDYVCSYANAGSGSHLYVLSEESADYLGEKFLETWKNIQLG